MLLIVMLQDLTCTYAFVSFILTKQGKNNLVLSLFAKA